MYKNQSWFFNILPNYTLFHVSIKRKIYLDFSIDMLNLWTFMTIARITLNPVLKYKILIKRFHSYSLYTAIHRKLVLFVIVCKRLDCNIERMFLRIVSAPKTNNLESKRKNFYSTKSNFQSEYFENRSSRSSAKVSFFHYGAFLCLHFTYKLNHRDWNKSKIKTGIRNVLLL